MYNTVFHVPDSSFIQTHFGPVKENAMAEQILNSEWENQQPEVHEFDDIVQSSCDRPVVHSQFIFEAHLVLFSTQCLGAC